jgi:hypothetical protein
LVARGSRSGWGCEKPAPFFVKRGFLCFVFPKGSLLHLAGLGSKEVGKSSLKVGWCSEALVWRPWRFGSLRRILRIGDLLPA